MSKLLYSTKDIILIGLFAAVLTGGKMALMLIPNIEIVTILIMLYSMVFGIKISLTATLIFCLTEGFLFGFNTWLISYFIHWPTLAVVSYALSKLTYLKNYIYIIVGGALTALFGVTSSAIDAIVSTNVSNINFFTMFSLIYIRGAAFYVTHIVSNVILIAVALPALQPLFTQAKKKYYNQYKM